MNSTILFTPSNEQLIEIANQDPELHSKIKNDIVKELQVTATKYVSSRIKSKAEKTYQNIYKNVEKKLFSSVDHWVKSPATFNSDIEKDFFNQIEKRLKADLQKEFELTFESQDFKNTLKIKIKEKLLTAVLKNLDDKIQAEAKKLTS